MIVRSNKIRQAAKGQECTINIPGVCKYDTDTTVLAHINDKHHGTGMKASDISACFACFDCHNAIDRTPICEQFEEFRDWYLLRGIRRTWEILIDLGIITVK